MSKQRATRDTLILPFTVGMLIGAVVMNGIACFALRSLLSDVVGYWALSMFFSAPTLIIGSLIQIAVLRLLSMNAAFPLSPRFSSIIIFGLGIAASSVFCLVIILPFDLKDAFLFHFLFHVPYVFILVISVLAPILLVKESDFKIVDQGGENVEQTQIRNREAGDKDEK